MDKKTLLKIIVAVLPLMLLLVGCGKVMDEQGEATPPSEQSATLEPLHPQQDENDPKPKPDELHEATYEYVKATLKGSELTIILPSEQCGEYPWLDQKLLDKPYIVEGTDGNYINLFIGTMGQDICPYAFLLTERRTVECVPIGNAIYGAGTGDLSFANMGELPEIANIVSFHEGIVDEEYSAYATVFAVDADGNEFDLSTPAYYMEHPQDAPPTGSAAMDALGYLLPQGMSMLDVGETEYIYDELCTLIAMGTNHAESFVRERLYAVSASGAIYLYDILADSGAVDYNGEPIYWTPVNVLAEVYSQSESFSDLFAVVTDPDGTELANLPAQNVIEVKTSVLSPLFQRPLLLVPLENDLHLAVELVDTTTPKGNETVLSGFADITVSRGDICEIYAIMQQHESPLRITATWSNEVTRLQSMWYAAYDDGGLPYKQYSFSVEVSD